MWHVLLRTNSPCCWSCCCAGLSGSNKLCLLLLLQVMLLVLLVLLLLLVVLLAMLRLLLLVLLGSTTTTSSPPPHPHHVPEIPRCFPIRSHRPKRRSKSKACFKTQTLPCSTSTPRPAHLCTAGSGCTHPAPHVNPTSTTTTTSSLLCRYLL
jgi:hypothetical protein